MSGLLASLFFITVAEMGDKTQLLTLSFAARYRAWKVLIGVTIGTLVVHFFSTLAGVYFAVFLPMNYIRLIVGVSFILFGLWTLRGDKLGGAAQTGRWGAVATVAVAFFLAELGDKTQLATIALAAQYKDVAGVWIGSTLGMVVADSIAIVVGAIAGQKLPERVIKLASAAVFILYGAFIIIER